MKCVTLPVTVVFLQLFNSFKCEINIQEYYRMPDVYKFDDYDKCFGVFETSAVYCVVNSFIKPDPSSELYGIIKKISSKTKQHLRHDKLQRGICLNSCKKLVRSLGNESQKYFVDEFPMDSKLIFDFIKYPNAEYDRLAYNEIINKCVNVELMDNYNLSAFSTVEYCKQNDPFHVFEFISSLDFLELLTAAIIAFIALLVALSSFYDRHLRSLSIATETHYRDDLKGRNNRLLTIFSIKRNWYNLSAPIKESVKDLQFIEAIRTLIMFGVIQNHCAMYIIALPAANPVFVDDAFATLKSMIYLCGNPIVQAFFVIGGFLTAFLFMTRMDKEKSSNMELFFRGIVGRYVRFAPLLILMVLLQSTWLYRLGGGPFWEQIIYTERQFCRDNWWTNLLFLDNYINVEHKCLIHTWYLAADFWCRILATLCLIQVYRKPTWKMGILTTIIGFSAVAIGITVYVFKLEAISIFPPENLRNQLLQASEDEPIYFKTLYSPTHLNLGNYFLGVITGLFYHRQKSSKQIFVVKLWHQVIFYVCVAIFTFNVLSNYVFYAYEFETPSIMNSLSAIALKHVWGVVVSVMILGLTQKVGWFVPNIMNHAFFRVMGRLTYATFMVHIFVAKLLITNVRQPLNLSDSSIFVYGIAVYIVSSAAGFVLTLCFEMPIATICSMLNLKKGL